MDPAPSDQELSEIFQALSNPNRVAIMRRLLERSLACPAAERPDDCSLDPTCCGFGELAADLEIGEATVSHHLKELRRSGLVERHREGRRIYVRANLDRTRELRAFLDPQAPSIDNANTC